MNKTKLVNCFLSGRRKSISKYENQTEELQSKVLQKLIRQTIHTEWGQTHGFAQVNDYNSFTKTSPINTYEELKGYIGGMPNHPERPMTKVNLFRSVKNACKIHITVAERMP